MGYRRRRTFTVRNTGQQPCPVSVLGLRPGTSPGFRLADGPRPQVTILPGASIGVPIEFTPATPGLAVGVAEVLVSDPTTPLLQVALSGRGEEPGLLILPTELDFATIGTGCATRTRTIRVVNTSSSSAVIDAVELTAGSVPAGFRLTRRPGQLPTAPFILAAGALAEVEVDYSATLTASVAGAVRITATLNGRASDHFVGLRGASSSTARQIDHFMQSTTVAADIVIVRDMTTSMTDEAIVLGPNLDALIPALQAASVDYQLAVTTTDLDRERGRFFGAAGGRVVSASSLPTPQAAFQSLVPASRALAGAAAVHESGLAAALRAVGPPARRRPQRWIAPNRCRPGRGRDQ